jgi:hypothetical protein
MGVRIGVPEVQHNRIQQQILAYSRLSEDVMPRSLAHLQSPGSLPNIEEPLRRDQRR